MPSARRKTPLVTARPSLGERLPVIPGRMNIGRMSKLTGRLNVCSINIGAGQYGEWTGLIYDGMDREEALKQVVPGISDEEVDFLVNGVTAEERREARSSLM